MSPTMWVVGAIAAAGVIGPRRPAPRGRRFAVRERRLPALPRPFATRRLRRSRREAVTLNLPELIDLLALGVAAGLTLRHAAEVVVAWLPAPYDDAMRQALGRADRGEPWADALARVSRELGPDTQSVFSVLIASERDGAPIAPALRRASDEARRRRRTRAEERVRRVPVLMLFPLVFCILPAFALLTVVPLLVGTVRDLQLP